MLLAPVVTLGTVEEPETPVDWVDGKLELVELLEVVVGVVAEARKVELHRFGGLSHGHGLEGTPGLFQSCGRTEEVSFPSSAGSKRP